jgi:hypothetical protein
MIELLPSQGTISIHVVDEVANLNQLFSVPTQHGRESNDKLRLVDLNTRTQNMEIDTIIAYGL